MLMKESNTDTCLAGHIVNRIKAGERDAEQELVTKYWRGLYFILNKRAKDPDLAADITQDTFIVVIEKARTGAINKPDAIGAFIRQTGVNLLIAYYRKETRRKTDSESDIQVEFPDISIDSSDKLHFKKLSLIVRQIMDELPTERDREILKQYFVYHCEKEKICETLDLSSAHFDRVLFRARDRLKKLLAHKLKINISEKSISHWLYVGLVLSCSYNLFTQTNIDINKYHDWQVRESSAMRHSIDRQRTMLDYSRTRLLQFEVDVGSRFL